MELQSPIAEKFRDKAVVVRSSAPGEDSSQASFAGLHESYVNIRGVEAILEHLRLVWATPAVEAALPGLVESIVAEAGALGYAFVPRTDGETAARGPDDLAHADGL